MKMILSNNLWGSHIELYPEISKTLKKFGLISHLLTLRASVFTSPDEAFVGNLSTGRLLLIIIFDWIRFYYFVKTHFHWRDSMTFFLNSVQVMVLKGSLTPEGKNYIPLTFTMETFAFSCLTKLTNLKTTDLLYYFHHPPLFYIFVHF